MSNFKYFSKFSKQSKFITYLHCFQKAHVKILIQKPYEFFKVQLQKIAEKAISNIVIKLTYKLKEKILQLW